MRYRFQLSAILAALMLVACGTDQPDLGAYVQQVARSNESMSNAVDQMRQWREGFESDLASDQVSFTAAREQVQSIVTDMEHEAARLASLEAPGPAADLRHHTLESYASTTEVIRKQLEVIEILEGMHRLRQLEQPDPAEGRVLVERYEIVQQEIAELSRQTRMQAERGRAEQQRLLTDRS